MTTPAASILNRDVSMTEASDLENEIKAAKEKYFSLLLKQREMKAAERKVCFDLPNPVNLDDFY